MIACDIGAESGRCMLGSFYGDTLSFREVYRFTNGPIRVNERLYWDILRLFSEVKDGLAKAVQDFGEIKAFGLDTWGVDFALLDAYGELLGILFITVIPKLKECWKKLFYVSPERIYFGGLVFNLCG